VDLVGWLDGVLGGGGEYNFKKVYDSELLFIDTGLQCNTLTIFCDDRLCIS
jgi:hypothetical protein